MKIKPLNPKFNFYLKTHQMEKKFTKALKLFEKDYKHPSLHFKILEPKRLKIYSFRIDIKFRTIFIITEGIAEIIAITDHYK